jgi:hypothetical protein
MKREILCLKCAAERSKRHGLIHVPELQAIVDPFPGEHVKYVRGISKSNFFCDACATINIINPGEECFAISTWADYGGIPYFEWEDEYIECK